MKKTTQAMIMILILLTALMATLEIASANFKVLTTTATLADAWWKTTIYNDSYYTAVSDEVIIDVQAKRAELYNSEDWLTSLVANAPAIVKVIMFVISIVIFIVIIAIWLYVIKEIIKDVIKQIKKTKKSKAMRKA